MKRIIIMLPILACVLNSFAQEDIVFADGNGSKPYRYPPYWTVNGETSWCGYTISSVINQADFIFEGRILTDSFYYDNNAVESYHRILVLKQFKGTYTSDTLMVSTSGGEMMINGVKHRNFQYSFKGDEALIWAYRNKGVLHDLYGYSCGYIKVCDKKDIKEVYKVIEKATGQKYTDIHPNNCATQQK